MKEPIDKFEDRFKLQDAAAAAHRASGKRWRVHGVFRFKTHEEADEWMEKLMAQKPSDPPIISEPFKGR